MSDQTMEKEGWGSAFGFIVTSIGYAVGLGAIWKFPYMIGMNGGGIFLLLFIILTVLVAVPLCWAELTLGRYTQCTAIVGMRQLAGKGSPWVLIGWMGLATGTVMVAYYITIVSDVMFYIYRFASCYLKGATIEETSAYYLNLQTNMPYKFITVLILYALTTFVLANGVQKGLERMNKILIPALFLFLLILAVRGLMLPGGMEGVKWLFTPDMSKISTSVVMSALNNCFFMAGVGIATLFSFGSYLDRENTDIPFSGSVIVLSNIVVAILAGLAIFTSLFTYGMDIASGAGLIFQTLPYVFYDMPGGIIWGTAFFVLVFCAGWSTLLGLVEGSASALGEALGLSRKKGLFLEVLIMMILSIPAILYTTVWANVRPLGMDLFTFMDFFAMLITLPIGAILISIYASTKFWDRYMEHSAVGAKYFRVPTFLRYWYMIVLPIVTIGVVVVGVAGYF